MIEFSGIAVRDPEIWIALCPEYDIATDGTTADESLSRLAGAVQEAAAVARENDLAIGRPTPADALAGLLAGHRGSLGPFRRAYRLDTDDPYFSVTHGATMPYVG